MRTKKLVLCALFAALTAAGAFIRIPLGFSTVTLQFLFAAMAGMLLGPKLGAVSQLVYMAVGLAGIPVFTQGGGFSYILNPSFGFILGFSAVAYVTGLVFGGAAGLPRMIAACLAGLAALYAAGLPYMYLIMNSYLGYGLPFSDIVKAGMLVYLPGDALKIAAACILTKSLAPTVRKALRAR